MIFMVQSVQITLKKWENALVNYGKLDQWNISDDYLVLGRYIASKASRNSKTAIQEVRDYAIMANFNSELLLQKVRNANKVIKALNKSQFGNNIPTSESVGQAKRFEGTTKRLFHEKLRFKGGQKLRSIDIEIEDGYTSRKVRRIVETRMCQAYHKQNKSYSEKGNKDRYYMKRATSFQLHNLGQVENVYGVSRTTSTHWKRSYDPITGEVVFKKKMAYSTLEEAQAAAIEFNRRHPHDKTKVTAYKCAYCGKYHIGHTTEISEELEESVVTFSSVLS